MFDFCHLCIGYFFFFKPKTAYEVRISDSSSDVCSSDLMERDLALLRSAGCDLVFTPGVAEMYPPGSLTAVEVTTVTDTLEGAVRHGHFSVRSEEHTSELQSLISISYSVFCLKKKKY